MNKVDPLLDEIVEQDTSSELPRFMSRLFDALGVHQEEKDVDTFILTPTETMVSVGVRIKVSTSFSSW